MIVTRAYNVYYRESLTACALFKLQTNTDFMLFPWLWPCSDHQPSWMVPELSGLVQRIMRIANVAEVSGQS